MTRNLNGTNLKIEVNSKFKLKIKRGKKPEVAIENLMRPIDEKRVAKFFERVD